jgi:DNA-binding NarL/FixJ family response regulator
MTQLSETQRVIAGLCDGGRAWAKRAAKELNMHPGTVEAHIRQIKAKTQRPRLTSRETEIFRLLGETGACNKELAKAAGCSEGTIKVTILVICQKFGVDNRVKLAIEYWKNRAEFGPE